MIDEFKLAEMIRDTAEDVIDEFEARKVSPLEQPPPFAAAIVLTLYKLAAKIDGKPDFVLTPRQSARMIRLNAERATAGYLWAKQLGLLNQDDPNVAPPVTPE